MDLKNKKAVITGGGSGIGKAAAILFAEKGAECFIISRTEEELIETVNEIKGKGGSAYYCTADISKVEEIKNAYEEVKKKWNKIDILFANAGINGVWAPLEEFEPEEWKKTIDVNLNGTFYTVKYALPLMKEKGGSIVITSSVNGTRMFSNTGATAYACTKAAQVAFTKMTAVELAQYKIRVNVICPGAIDTEIDDNTKKKNVEKVKVPVKFPEGQIPLTDGEPGTSRQTAKLVLFLASDESDHITGTEVWIDGAQSLLQG
jgi:NAD(P)-dependent dehydrogenase (short-subunit alcohol dehydrogenase family)